MFVVRYVRLLFATISRSQKRLYLLHLKVAELKAIFELRSVQTILYLKYKKEGIDFLGHIPVHIHSSFI